MISGDRKNMRRIVILSGAILVLFGWFVFLFRTPGDRISGEIEHQVERLLAESPSKATMSAAFGEGREIDLRTAKRIVLSLVSYPERDRLVSAMHTATSIVVYKTQEWDFQVIVFCDTNDLITDFAVFSN